ncbi:hypothetical protein [Lysinibacillus sp. NPDC093692]|uniref:hypothetical protein n=1 Tax=Lysinibacillus sp. NPDC093692 TaxID=3390578 RepID=UPI003D08C981
MVGNNGAKGLRKIYIQLGIGVPGSMEFWVKQSIGELNAWMEAIDDIEGVDG